MPELLVADVHASLRFWCELCGFAVVYHRLDEGFAYLDRGGAQVMLEERGRGRNWVTGPLDAPLGRGVNFQIGVEALTPILDALGTAGWPLFMAAEQKWYRRGPVEVGVHQVLVQDPDGYLVRFSAGLGERAASNDVTGDMQRRRNESGLLLTDVLPVREQNEEQRDPFEEWNELR